MPEGTGRARPARPRWLVLAMAALVIYLGVRLVQGVVWVVEWLW